MPEQTNTNFLMGKYRILGKKGEGTFSEVLKCQNVKDGSYWACKKMKQHYESVEQINSLREIQALRRLSPHGNILELHEVVFDKKTGTLVLICELMDMNIYELIRDRGTFIQESKIKNYMYQLLKSIDHMHRNGIFHRDVKPENILIKDDLLKLADFGSCRSVYSKQPYTEYISTRWYRAPECLLTDGYYTYKMDIWSIGCVFFEILSLQPLFPGSNEVDQIAKIHDIMGTPEASTLNKLRNKTRGMNFNFPPKKGTGIEKMLNHASPESLELIYQMCAYDPDARVSAKQALKHPYFKDLRDSEKRVAAALNKPHTEDTADNTRLEEDSKPVKSHSKDHPDGKGDRGESGSPPGNQENKKRGSPVRSLRPTSGTDSTGTFVARYPASILHNRDPVYNYHRREKRRRRKMRMEPSQLSNSGLLPKVAQAQTSSRSSTFQPAFQTTTFAAGTLPKIGGATSTTTTTTFLPSLGQAFMKPVKPKQVTTTQAGGPQATKNVFGHYQLPSIDRRGAGP